MQSIACSREQVCWKRKRAATHTTSPRHSRGGAERFLLSAIMLYLVDSGIYMSFLKSVHKGSSAHVGSGPRSREKFSGNNSTGCDAG